MTGFHQAMTIIAGDVQKVNTRNFAIDLLQRMDLEPEKLAESFRQYARTTSRKEFGVMSLTSDELFGFIQRLTIINEGRKRLMRIGRSDARLCLGYLRNNAEDLFRAIDISNTGSVTWSDFLSFLVESTMKGRVEPNSDIHSYNLSSTSHSKQQVMQKISYLPTIDKILINTAKSIRVADSRNPTTQFSSIHIPGKLLCTTYLPEYRLVAAASADLHVRLFDVKTGRSRSSQRCEESQISMAWYKREKRLYTGSRCGHVSCWGLKFTRDGERDVSEGFDATDIPNVNIQQTLLRQSQPHHSPVQAIMFLPLSDKVVSASLDPAVVIQDPLRPDVVVAYEGVKAGILDLAFSCDNGLLLAGGLQREVMAWPLSSARHPPLVLVDKYHPHCNPVVGLHAVAGTPQIISFGSCGMIKIWDSRTLRCVQTILKPQEEGSTIGTTLPHVKGIRSEYYQAMTFIDDRRTIIVNNRRSLYFYDYQHEIQTTTAERRSTADSHPIAGALYENGGQMLYIASGNRIRCWDLSLGRICSTFTGLVPSSIVDNDSLSCMATPNSTGRSVLHLGTYTGDVRSYTSCNGSLISTYKPLVDVVERGSPPQSPKKKTFSCNEIRNLIPVVANNHKQANLLLGYGWGDPRTVFVINLTAKEITNSNSLPQDFTKKVISGYIAVGLQESHLMIAEGYCLEIWKLHDRPQSSIVPFKAAQYRSESENDDYQFSIIKWLSPNSPICIAARANGDLIFVKYNKYKITIEPVLTINGIFKPTPDTPIVSLTSLCYSSAMSCVYTADERGFLQYVDIISASTNLPLDPLVLKSPHKVLSKEILHSPVQGHSLGITQILTVEASPYNLAVSYGADICVRIWTSALIPVGYLDPYEVTENYFISKALKSSGELEGRNKLEISEEGEGSDPVVELNENKSTTEEIKKTLSISIKTEPSLTTFLTDGCWQADSAPDTSDVILKPDLTLSSQTQPRPLSPKYVVSLKKSVADKNVSVSLAVAPAPRSLKGVGTGQRSVNRKSEKILKMIEEGNSLFDIMIHTCKTGRSKNTLKHSRSTAAERNRSRIRTENRKRDLEKRIHNVIHASPLAAMKLCDTELLIAAENRKTNQQTVEPQPKPDVPLRQKTLPSLFRQSPLSLNIKNYDEISVKPIEVLDLPPAFSI